MTQAEQRLLDSLRPGVRAYLSAASAEPLALIDLLKRDPGRTAGVNFIGSFVPGVNRTDYTALDPAAHMTTLLLPPPLRPSFEAKRVEVLPLSYSAFADHLQRLPPDVAIVQVTPPDANGRCTLGPAADFAPVALGGATRRFAFVNPLLPKPPGAWTLDANQFDALIDCDHPPLSMQAAGPSATTEAIAATVATFIEDGTTLQVGLGGAPAAAMSILGDRRELKIHSGMVSDELVTLADAGALAKVGHCTGVAIGGARLYDWLPGAVGLEFAPTPQTHGARALAGIKRFTAINGALSVDLFGQINLEWLNGRLASGVGGAPDFMAGARLSPGGLSIVALPATVREKSRIVLMLDTPSVSIARNMVDVVVTEHGAADLRDLPLDRRAEAMIGVAAPEHRTALWDQWVQLRRSL